jgi:hypothetical protein
VNLQYGFPMGVRRNEDLDAELVQENGTSMDYPMASNWETALVPDFTATRWIDLWRKLEILNEWVAGSSQVIWRKMYDVLID